MTIADLLPLIRFPVMPIESVVRHVIPANVLPLDVVVQVLTYIAAVAETSCSANSVSMPTVVPPLPPRQRQRQDDDPMDTSTTAAGGAASSAEISDLKSSNERVDSEYQGIMALAGLPPPVPMVYTFPFPCTPRGACFTHAHDFDTHGIIYYMGTKRKRDSVWANPYSSGLLGIKHAPTNLTTTAGSYSLGDVVGRQQACIYVFSHTPAPVYFAFDFRTLTVCPSAYTIRTWTDPAYSHSPTMYHMRHWKLQGSHDESEWHDVSVHSNDTTPVSYTHLTLPTNREV